MKRIHDHFQKLIHWIFDNTQIPDSFIAAIIANESDGDPRTERLEAPVLRKLEEVRAGKRAEFNGLRKRDLEGLDDTAIHALATSYGLTQVMGYHMGIHCRPEILLNPAWNLREGLTLLRDFIHRPHLGPSDAEKLFRCWNTGRPDGKTTDPDYVAKGMARMAVYEEILRSAQNDKPGAASGSTAPIAPAAAGILDGDFMVSDPEICL